MNKRKLMAILYILGSLACVLIVVGNGCGGQFQIDQSALGLKSASNSSTGSASGGAGQTEEVIPGTKTVSVVYAKQVLDQLSTCAGVSTPSDSTLNVYESKKGAVSVYGTADTITSPMMMAIMSISGEICNDLINQEKDLVQKRIFKGWDLKSNTLPSSGLMNDAVTRLALSCWQRPENSGERQEIQDAVYSVSNGESQAANKAALILCTSMLSSLNSLLN